LFLTRLVFDTMGRYSSAKTMKMLQFFKEPKINFLGMRNLTTLCSATIVIMLVVFIGWKGKDALGIDFTGGTQVVYSYHDYVSGKDIKDALRENGFNAKVTHKNNVLQNSKELEIVLRDKDVASQISGSSSIQKQILDILMVKFPDAGFSGGRETSIGGLIGWEFSKSAMIAIVLAIIGIIVYISFRFEFAFAIAAIIAIIHDVLIASGIFILCGHFFPGIGELSLPVIAALLTIIGYSLNDTIVVFDRIREDLTLIKNKSYKDIINLSINQTLSRTILTSLTTLIVLVVLFLAGGVAIRDFVFVMIIGVFVGTYSSIFIASPIVSVWHRRIGAGVK